MQPGLGTAVDMAAQGLADAGSAGARLLEAQGHGYGRLRAKEEIGMKMFGPPPPFFINQLDN